MSKEKGSGEYINGTPASQHYQGIREHDKKKEEQRNIEENIVDKAGENPKLFLKFMRSQLKSS